MAALISELFKIEQHRVCAINRVQKWHPPPLRNFED
jgi:hypothetical protein